MSKHFELKAILTGLGIGILAAVAYFLFAQATYVPDPRSPGMSHFILWMDIYLAGFFAVASGLLIGLIVAAMASRPTKKPADEMRGLASVQVHHSRRHTPRRTTHEHK